MPTQTQKNHLLVGAWIDPHDEFQTVQYTVRATLTRLLVSAIDVYDGERIEISDVSWSNHELRFQSYVPSTKWRLRHIFRVISRDKIEHEYTKADIWKRKGSAPVKKPSPETIERRIAPRGNSGESQFAWKRRAARLS